MAMEKPEREIPWCTICLVVSCLVAQSLVLAGNIMTAQALTTLGSSVHGWSDVGLGLSKSMDTELDDLMVDVEHTLTTAIGNIQELQHTFDLVLGLSGSVTDDLLKTYDKAHKQQEEKKLLLLQGAAPKTAGAQLPGVGAGTGANRTNKLGAAEEDLVVLMQSPARRAAESKSSARALTGRAVTSSTRSMLASYRADMLRLASRSGRRSHQEPLKTSDVEGLIGGLWHSVSANNTELPSPEQLKKDLPEALGRIVHPLMGFLNTKLHGFYQLIQPALRQVGKWVVSFGESLTNDMQGFSQTIDHVQKVLDQVLSSLHKDHTNAAEMVHQTWTLFDTNHSGSITLEQLEQSAYTYTLQVLQGEKGKELFDRYDPDHDGRLNKEEYAQLVNDPSVPNVMAITLRAVAKALGAIAGRMKKARMRDEVAEAVTQYLALQAAKNITKVGWVSQALANGSLPIQFSAAVLNCLVGYDADPARMVKLPVGPIVTKYMVFFNATYVGQIMMLLADPAFWNEQGFTPNAEASTVKKVATWIVHSPGGKEAILSLDVDVLKKAEKLHGTRSLEWVPEVLANFTARRSEIYLLEHPTTSNARELYDSPSGEQLLNAFLGGVPASAANSDPSQQQALRVGQPALPSTLLFAKHLSNNATATAHRYQDFCMTYSGKSSNDLDSISNYVQTFIKKTQSFIISLENFATPTGINRTENMITRFTGEAGNDVIAQLMQGIDRLLPPAASNASAAAAMSLSQEPGDEQVVQAVGGIIHEVITLVTQIQLLLPSVVKDLKFARSAVSGVGLMINDVFTTFKNKAPPVFVMIGSLYKTLWVAYFVFFATLTVAVFFYGFWASGWFGGPTAAAPTGDDYEGPKTCRERFLACCSCCCTCMAKCHDSSLCFWSVIILLEILVMLMFVVAIILCLLAGIKAFISAGCQEVYMLSEGSVCQGVLGTIRGFLSSFLLDSPVPFDGQCNEQTLLTCKLIGSDLQNSMIFTVLGSMMAAVLSYQMIVESAIMHERIRWRRIFDEEAKTA